MLQLYGRLHEGVHRLYIGYTGMHPADVLPLQASVRAELGQLRLPHPKRSIAEGTVRDGAFVQD